MKSARLHGKLFATNCVFVRALVCITNHRKMMQNLFFRGSLRNCVAIKQHEMVLCEFISAEIG